MIMHQALPTSTHAFAASPSQHHGVMSCAARLQPSDSCDTLAETHSLANTASAAAAVPFGSIGSESELLANPVHTPVTVIEQPPNSGSALSLHKQFQDEMVRMHAADKNACSTREIDRTDHVDVDHRLSKAEAAIESALRRIFPNHRFVKVRPAWLTNVKTKRRLEIDLYSESLALGIERGGVQHYVFPNGVHASRAAFEALQERDRLKVALCKERGVTLIDVPFTVPAKGAEAFLRDELRRLNFRAQSAGHGQAL